MVTPTQKRLLSELKIVIREVCRVEQIEVIFSKGPQYPMRTYAGYNPASWSGHERNANAGEKD